MRNILKALFTALIISLFIFLPASSYAYWNGHGGHGYSGGHGGHGYGGGWRGGSYVGVNFAVWPDSYYYGAPYYPYPPDDDVLVSSPVDQVPVTVVQPPPVTVDQSQTVVVNQAAEPAAPVITPAAGNTTPDTPDSVTINIPNSKGGYTAVTLKKSGNGFIGPQGEFYPEFPAVAKLEVIYGK